ncbi:MAG TPA: hypothetical protein VGX02_07620 [Candidatus Eremiobacteraceae bacterium]|nr:hypothetical protein [Candidatus Eremiobacteraceae bacterium]
MNRVTHGFPGWTAFVAVAILAAQNLASAEAAVTPSPTPAASAVPSSQTPAAPAAIPGVMFDQIDRTLTGDATPPPPGSFASELARIQRAASGQNGVSTPGGQSIGSQLGNMALSQIPIVGSLIVSANMKRQQQQAQQRLQESLHPQPPGVLTHYAFYNGWSRVEVPGQYATIKRPDLHQTILLDLQNRTYTTVSDDSSLQTPVPAATVVGSGQLLSTATWSLKDPLTIEGLATSHYEGGDLLVVSQSSGACQDGMIRANEIEYVTDALEPLPLPPNGVEKIALPAGCNASISHKSAGDDPSNRFYVYRVIRVEGGSALAANASTPVMPGLQSMFANLPGMPAMPGRSGPSNVMYKLSIRSNITILGPADAAMFSPPADFTPTK